MQRYFRHVSALLAATMLLSLTAVAAFADETNTNSNTNTATNVAVSDQAAAAVSGDASAFDDSIAVSGEAVAVTESYQSQAIIQVKLNQALVGCECEFPSGGEGDTTNDNSNDATAANAAGSTQAVAAVSGIAYAEDTSGGFTGPAFVASINSQQQTTIQVDGNQVVVDTAAFGF